MAPLAVVAVAAVAVVAASGCGPGRGGGGERGDTGGGSGRSAGGEHADVPEGDTSPPLARPSKLGGDFVLEQRVTMEHPEGENSFRAVLEKKGDRLTLLGLAPHGGRAFVLVQQGDAISFESFMPRKLPFPPEYMMHDVHRAWFLTERDRPALQDRGEKLTVEREQGRVVVRRYERTDGRTDEAVEVHYEGGLPEGAPTKAAPPDRVVLENDWYDYTATLETLSWRPL